MNHEVSRPALTTASCECMFAFVFFLLQMVHVTIFMCSECMWSERLSWICDEFCAFSFFRVIYFFLWSWNFSVFWLIFTALVVLLFILCTTFHRKQGSDTVSWSSWREDFNHELLHLLLQRRGHSRGVRGQPGVVPVGVVRRARPEEPLHGASGAHQLVHWQHESRETCCCGNQTPHSGLCLRQILLDLCKH